MHKDSHAFLRSCTRALYCSCALALVAASFSIPPACPQAAELKYQHVLDLVTFEGGKVGGWREFSKAGTFAIEPFETGPDQTGPPMFVMKVELNGEGGHTALGTYVGKKTPDTTAVIVLAHAADAAVGQRFRLRLSPGKDGDYFTAYAVLTPGWTRYTFPYDDIRHRGPPGTFPGVNVEYVELLFNNPVPYVVHVAEIFAAEPPPVAPATELLVDPAEAAVGPGRWQQFRLCAKDALGRPVQLPRDVAWSVDPQLGQIDERGLFGPARQVGRATVTAVAAGLRAESRLVVAQGADGLQTAPPPDTVQLGATSHTRVIADLEQETEPWPDYSAKTDTQVVTEPAIGARALKITTNGIKWPTAIYKTFVEDTDICDHFSLLLVGLRGTEQDAFRVRTRRWGGDEFISKPLPLPPPTAGWVQYWIAFQDMQHEKDPTRTFPGGGLECFQLVLDNNDVYELCLDQVELHSGKPPVSGVLRVVGPTAPRLFRSARFLALAYEEGVPWAVHCPEVEWGVQGVAAKVEQGGTITFEGPGKGTVTARLPDGRSASLDIAVKWPEP